MVGGDSARLRGQSPCALSRLYGNAAKKLVESDWLAGGID